MESELLNSSQAVKTLLESLDDSKGHIFVDLEGNNLSRNGTLSLITMLVEGNNRIYLVDVTELKSAAFSTASSTGLTLKKVFESKNDFVKIFFDVRNDSDALFSLHGIKLDGIEDLQLMELASRSFSKRCVNGLAKCIERDANIAYREQRDWQRTKDQGRRLFDPKLGGSFDVFDHRPLPGDLIKYCTQDVQHMPHLYEQYKAKLCDAWWVKIQDETKARIRLSQSVSFNGQGRHMAEGPRDWVTWQPSLTQRQIRTLLDGPMEKPASVSAVAAGQEPTEEAAHIALSLQRLRLADALPAGSVQHLRDDHDDSDEDDRRSDDFTACDAECGYCGSCEY